MLNAFVSSSSLSFSPHATVSLILRNHVAGLSFVLVLAVVFVVVFFAVGPGPVPFVVAAEIFPAEANNAAMSLCLGGNWLMNYVVAVSFLPLKVSHMIWMSTRMKFFNLIESLLQGRLGDYVFIPYLVICASFFTFTFVLVPETKGDVTNWSFGIGNSQHRCLFESFVPRSNGRGHISINFNKQQISRF